MTEPQIVAAGIRIADAEGLEAVSIRRVVAEFAGRPMSLYSFVASKQRLIELMVDEVFAEMVLDVLPSGWRAGLHAIAERTLEVGSLHPWLIEATVRGRPSGPSAQQHAAQSLAAVAEFGLTEADAAPLLRAIDAYTIGFALTSQSPAASAETTNLTAFAPGLDWLLSGFASARENNSAHDRPN